MQFVNEYTTSKKYVPKDPMIAAWICAVAIGELLTACELNAELSRD
jgi:hypothetical protein